MSDHTCANATVQRLGRIEMAKMQLLELLMIIQCQCGAWANKFCFYRDKNCVGYRGRGISWGSLHWQSRNAQHWYQYNRVGPVSHAPAFKKSSGWCKMNVNGALEDHEHWGSIQNQIQDTEG